MFDHIEFSVSDIAHARAFYGGIVRAIGGEEMAFQEVSGLDTETEVLEYRAGNSKVFSKVKMPGMMKSKPIPSSGNLSSNAATENPKSSSNKAPLNSALSAVTVNAPRTSSPMPSSYSAVKA